MKIIYADDNLPFSDSVVVLGNFDGVHCGHRTLVEKAISIAKDNNLPTVIYTFSEHPQKFFGKNVEILTTNDEKEKIFDELGVDFLVYQKPDKEFLSLSPEAFVAKIVDNYLNAKYVVVGKHYSFGAKAKGTSDNLKVLAEKFGIKVFIEELLECNHQVVSSSLIRECLKNGEIFRANELLGREFSISGEVVHGNHLGTGIGFPTANINFASDKIVPKYGVYVGKAQVGDEEYNSVINIGVKPTVGGNVPLLEAHIIDADCDFYGEKFTFRLFAYIREEQKFEGLNELKNQIAIDLQKTKEYFE